MTISIVIPTYNGERYIREAIDSALNQTSPADEVIVSDDNSTDSTLEIFKEYGNRIKVFQNPNGPSGFVNGWNNAITHATSDFIAILHQDDRLAPTFIEEIQYAFKLHPDVKHFFVPCNYIDENGKIIRTPTEYCSNKVYRFTGQEYAEAYELVKGHIHRCPGVVTHREILKKNPYREEAGHIADDDFFLRVGNYTDIVGVLKPLASYREHSSSETGHLSFLAINKRLLRDYHFQLEHASDNPLLSKKIIQIFQKWEAEYIHRLIVYGYKDRQFNHMITALNFWLSFKRDKRFGNITYDLQSLGHYLFSQTKQLHIKWLNFKNSRKTNNLGIDNPFISTLIIAPHPDDEVIGCGGLIAKMVAEGNAPHIVVLTGGEGSHRGCCGIQEGEIVEARRGLTHDALKVLGVPEGHLHELNFKDGGIGKDEAEIEKLQLLINELKPERILVPHWGEGWPDHLAARDLGLRLAPKEAEVWEYCVWMWYYNVWRGLDWKNAAKVEMTLQQHELKLKAMDAYVKPLAPCGRPWSGVLPQIFLKANSGKRELYFKVK